MMHFRVSSRSLHGQSRERNLAVVFQLREARLTHSALVVGINVHSGVMRLLQRCLVPVLDSSVFD